jgi:hypothetical protein
MDWCQLEADERQPNQNQRSMSRQGQSLLRLGQCWEGQYQPGQSQPGQCEPERTWSQVSQSYLGP